MAKMKPCIVKAAYGETQYVADSLEMIFGFNEHCSKLKINGSFYSCFLSNKLSIMSR